MEDTGSLHNYYKNLIRLRNQFPSIRKGSTEQLDAKMLEATLVSGETPVSAEGQTMTLPEYSVAVIEVE